MGRKAKPRAEGQPVNLGKREIIDAWESAPEGSPCMVPMPQNHIGTSYMSDTIRITGSRESIESILGCLKPLLELESAGSRLRLTYKQTVDKQSGELTDSWAFYASAQDRGKTAYIKKPARKPQEPPPALPAPEIKESPAALPTPTQGPRPKGFRRPKKEVAERAVVVTSNANNEPVYGIGVQDGDTLTWVEPSAIDEYPCDTYIDLDACKSAIESMKRGSLGSKAELQPIELVKIGGKVRVNGPA